MATVLSGMIRGRVIELESDVGQPDGQNVRRQCGSNRRPLGITIEELYRLDLDDPRLAPLGDARNGWELAMISRGIRTVLVCALLVSGFTGCGGPEGDADSDNGAAPIGHAAGEHTADPANVVDPPPVDGGDPSPDDGPAKALAIRALADAEDASEFDGERVELSGLVVVPGRVDPVRSAMVVLVNADGLRTSVLTGLHVNVQVPLPGETRLRTLAPGQEVTARGTLRNVSGNVWQLEGAKVLAIGEAGLVEVTATELTRAFVDDAPAAAEKYGAKPLKVTGTLLSAKKFGQYAAYWLEGVKQDGTVAHVVVQVDPDHFAEYGKDIPTADGVIESGLAVDGETGAFLGTLDANELDDGPDGNPTLYVRGYPANWREPGDR